MKTVIAALAFALCLSGYATHSQAQGIPFRISLNTGPNHVRNIALEEFVNKLQERTKGKLDVQVFPSAQLFKGPDVPKALAQGSIEMGVPIILYISRVVPNAGLLDLPMFYGLSIDEIHKVMDGEVGQKLNAEIEETLKVKVIGKYLDLGHSTVFTTEKPATSLEALRGLKLRVAGSPAAKVRYDSLGVQSVSISFADVPISLAQKSIDGLATTHETVRSAKLWESGLNYSLDTQGAFINYVPLIGQPTWEKLDSDTQQIILNTWAETIGGARALAAERQKSAREDGIKNGIKNQQASAQELAEFRDQLLSQQASIVEAARMDPEFVALAERVLNN